MVASQTVPDYLRIFDKYDSSQWLEQALLRLHAETAAETKQRESSAFDRIASPCQSLRHARIHWCFSAVVIWGVWY
jgi:hypothetical protein